MTRARRQTRRVSIDVRFRGGGASTNLTGRITDLSATGLFLATQKYLPLGAEVHLEFELPTGLVEAVGEVRWLARGQVAEQGVGLRFLRLSAPSALAIDLQLEADRRRF